jgi:hypothetical protein
MRFHCRTLDRPIFRISPAPKTCRSATRQRLATCTPRLTSGAASMQPLSHLTPVGALGGSMATEPWKASGTDVAPACRVPAASLAAARGEYAISLKCWLPGDAHARRFGGRRFASDSSLSFGSCSTDNRALRRTLPPSWAGKEAEQEHGDFYQSLMDGSNH